MAINLKPEEISAILKKQVADWEATADVYETGSVLSVGDGIARVYGLQNVMANELVEFSGGMTGLALNLEEENVGVAIMGEDSTVHEGDEVRRTKRIASVPIGEALSGRIVDALGNAIDGGAPISRSELRPVEIKAPGIMDRQNVCEPMQTGIKVIDALTPIGRGQRELIIGDRKTGKTTLAIDTIINQVGQDVRCFYVAIGQKRSSVASLYEKLKQHGAMPFTTIGAATASDAATLQYLAPYSACAMAEYFRDSGRHALIVYDDLTKHAQAYRQISLLLRRPPGREAFPGDIFYLHSRLLERAAKLSAEKGGGSMTALPIVETQANDISAYIPTNVISITDGQIFLESALFNSGQRPAVNPGISVSRVGGDAQLKAMKKTSGSLRIELAQFRELEAFSQFSSDLDKSTLAQLNRGKRLMEIMKQPPHQPLSVAKQVALIYAGVNGYMDGITRRKVKAFEVQLMEAVDASGQDYLKLFEAKKDMTPEVKAALDALLTGFKSRFKG
ncbi:MAG: F0F1 ATP synthase subunit alpha [Lentisphaerota bacterium]